MTSKLTWLHISDIHFLPNKEWRDSQARDSLLEYLEEVFKGAPSLLPDMVFCTGDIAYGETGKDPLTEQYEQARSFFDQLLVVCGKDGTPLVKERLFVVPGNHDINRKIVNSDAQATLTLWAKEGASNHAEEINQRFQDRPNEFLDAIKRLDEYGQFIRDYLPHQVDEDGRHCFANIVDIEGLKVGVAGFNSAWSCAGPEDDRTVWLAAEWQFNTARTRLKEADLRIGLIHHPVDWLNSADRDVATKRISTDFHFWLHGHAHNAWVTPTQSHITIAAGAVGADTSEEFGVNLVRLDLQQQNGGVELHKRSSGEASWTIAAVGKHAPRGIWQLDPLPQGLCENVNSPVAPSSTPANINEKRTIKLFGREALLKEATDKLNRVPFLLIYGLRGNGKTSLIEELEKSPPLLGKELARITALPSTNVGDLFRQIAVLLGESAEFPQPPKGSVSEVAEEIRQRYPNPRPSWVWIDRAHHLIGPQGFYDKECYTLLLGLQAALGTKWHWLLELRERPPQRLLGQHGDECEVPGLTKNSLAECLSDSAPAGRDQDWLYKGDQLKRIYNLLGGGHGSQAHPQAIQLLIEVARGHDETPLEVLQRHLGDFEEGIEKALLGDLYSNVLSEHEQKMLQALALYRAAIPHDHADGLERDLAVPGAWDGLDRRCLLSANADHSSFFLHNFISSWVRSRHLGYAGHEEEVEYLTAIPDELPADTQSLHKTIAGCWLTQLGGSRRATNLNISRALEVFHHLLSAGDGGRLQEIAVELLTGNLAWARQHMKRRNEYLHKINAPTIKLREVLEYRAVLDPNDHAVQRFLGQCWQKEEGRGSDRALHSFERACLLRRDFPPYWADLGKTLLARGCDGASDFLTRLELLEQECPIAINDHVRAIQADCLKLIGDEGGAAALRMEQIHARSRHAAFYSCEANARLAAGDSTGALDILDLAEKNGVTNDHTLSIRATVLQQTDPKQAAALRLEQIHAGSNHAAIYGNEAHARLTAGDPTGALDILDLAEKNGAVNDYTMGIRATVLQQTDPKQATALRLQKIHAGSCDAIFYVAEANARLAEGDPTGALEILDLAERNGAVNDYTMAIRIMVLQQTDPKKAAALRLEMIHAGSCDAVFYNDEANARLAAGDPTGALEILDLAEKNGAATDYTMAIRATVLQKNDPKQATELRMEKIKAGSHNCAFYVDEANARLAAGDPTGALEIIDLADKNGLTSNYTRSIRKKVLKKIGHKARRAQ
jgi:predicted phosphodiesterase